MTKKCCRCQSSKPLTEFTKNNNYKDKLESRCKQCIKEVRDINTDSPRAAQKRTRRPCIGMTCRGEKSFYAWPGQRICRDCKIRMEGMAAPYQF